MWLLRNRTKVEIQLDPLTHLKLRTYIAIIAWGVRYPKGSIQADAGRLAKMFREGRRECVECGGFLYFFKDDTLTHVIQKMELFEITDSEFVNFKFYKHTKKGKDQLVKFDLSQNVREKIKTYKIDPSLLEEDEIYYLAERLGRPPGGLSRPRFFYFKNGRLLEMLELKNLYRYLILENEKSEFEKRRGTKNLKARLLKNAKITKTNKLTQQGKRLRITNHFKEVIQKLNLDIDAQKIINTAPFKQLEKIASSSNEIVSLFDDGVIDRQRAMAWLKKYSLIASIHTERENSQNEETGSSVANAKNGDIDYNIYILGEDKWDDDDEEAYLHLKSMNITDEGIEGVLNKKIEKRLIWLNQKRNS